MFRPERVGPWPIIDLGSVWNPVTNQLQGFVEDQVRPVYQRAAVRGDYDNVFIDENSDTALAAASGFTLALAVEGSHPSDLPVHVVYSVVASIHSRVTGANNRAGVNLRAFLGRSSSSALPTLSSTATDHGTHANRPLHLLPAQSIFIASDRHAVSTTDREFSHISCEGQMVVRPGVNANPLFVALSVYNPDGESAITVSNMSISMALHKYVGDVDTFDPTR